MATSSYETSHRIFQERPEILAPMFRIVGVPLAEQACVEVLTPDATELRPLERRVDSVLRVTPPDGDGFLLAIEAQGRRDADKPVNWAYYVAHLQAKYRSPVLLLVVCQDKATADWAVGPSRAEGGGAGKADLEWSPEQIAAHLRTRWPDRPERHLCHESIYRALHHGVKGGLSRTNVVLFLTPR